jgi:site-specific recombinase XerD
MESSLLPALIPVPVPPPAAFAAVSATLDIQATAVAPAEASDTLLAALEAAERFIDMAMTQGTKKAYKTDFAHFQDWCRTERLPSLPAKPQTVALYLAAMAEAGFKISTITRRLAAITMLHKDRDLPSPASLRHKAVGDVIRGIRRDKGTRPEQKRALTSDELRKMVTALPSTPHGLRDRALLLIGFAGGFRRSELAAIDFADVEDGDDGLTILIRRSKTDQEGEGRKIGIAYGGDPKTCPLRAYRKWIKEAQITEGPIFRHFHNQTMGTQSITDRVVALTIKKAAERVGLDAASLAGHSLRSGLATTAARNGASEASIMKQTGHKSVTMVRRYIREGSLFHDNASTKLGL